MSSCDVYFSVIIECPKKEKFRDFFNEFYGLPHKNSKPNWIACYGNYGKNYRVYDADKIESHEVYCCFKMEKDYSWKWLKIVIIA